MSRTILFFVTTLAVTVLLAAIAPAEELRPSLAAELGWVKFRVTGGRLQIVSTQSTRSRTYEAGNPLAGESETLRIDVADGARYSNSAALTYELKNRAQRLTVHFDSPYSVVIERTPIDGDDITPVKLTQPRDGPLELVIDTGTKPHKVTAESIWHLMLLQPELMRQHVLPILFALRPGWPLEDTAAGIENALVQIAASEALPNRDAWAKLVEQLGSGSFRQRRQAERLLRNAGPAVVVYLKTLPTEKFDAERRSRIERLLQSLSSTADDTPSRIAVWLVDDPLIWTSVLASDDREHRAVAKEQLEILLAREIEFDVDGPAAMRTAQVSELREALD